MILYERGGTIRRVIDEWFRRSGVVPRIAMELGNGEAIKKMVAAGLGLSVTSAMSLAAEVRARELIARPLAPPLGRRLGIVRRRDRAASPALRAFLDGLEALAVRRRGSRRASATPSRA